MKELLSFSFLVLFIACQNQPFENSKYESTFESKTSVVIAAPSPFESCTTLTQEPLDVVKELEHKENPGFHYREAELMSEASENSHSELICIERVTEANAVETVAIEETEQPAEAIQADSPASWETLTDRWTYVPEKLVSLDKKAQMENPACDETGIFSTSKFETFSREEASYWTLVEQTQI